MPRPSQYLSGAARRNVPRLGVRAALVAALLLSGTARLQRDVIADEPAAEADPAPPVSDGASRARLTYMMQALGRYHVAVGDETLVESPLRAEPLLRWMNPVSTVQDGVIAVFTRGGRPDVYAELQLHTAGYAVHEFAWITPEPVTVKRDGQAVWHPQERWVKLAEFTDAPAPARKESARLVQMRDLARGFKVVDHFGWREEEITLYELRLMARPAYRYSAPGIIDGALFVFAQGTNPEATLLIEAFDDAGRTGWRYALAPSTIYELVATLDSQEVWRKPRYLGFSALNGPYYAGKYRPDPADRDLSELLPSAGIKAD